MTPDQPITLRQRLRALATLLGIGLACMGVVLFVLSRMGRPHESGLRVICAANLRQIELMLREYTTRYGAFPPDLMTLLNEGGESEFPVLVCPSTDDVPARSRPASDAEARRDEHLSYYYFPPPASRPIDQDWPVVIDIPGNHGRDGLNVLFIRGYTRGSSGHSAFVPRDEVGSLLRPLKQEGVILPGELVRWLK